MSALTEVLAQIQRNLKDLKTRVDKIEPREMGVASKKNILDMLEVDTDAGTAQPVNGNLDVLGGVTGRTQGAVNVVTIDSNAIVQPGAPAATWPGMLWVDDDAVSAEGLQFGRSWMGF